MNSVKLQDTQRSIYKNCLCFYILKTNYQKENLRKQSHLQLHQKNKIPWNKFYQGSERPVLLKQ